MKKWEHDWERLERNHQNSTQSWLPNCSQMIYYNPHDYLNYIKWKKKWLWSVACYHKQKVDFVLKQDCVIIMGIVGAKLFLCSLKQSYTHPFFR